MSFFLICLAFSVQVDYDFSSAAKVGNSFIGRSLLEQARRYPQRLHTVCLGSWRAAERTEGLEELR